jgi:NAD(P)H-hydrate epimerase
MDRPIESHKGENGKVAVIGGSLSMHGAPLFSALGAEASGCDLVYVSLPRCHWEIAKEMSLNFQIHPFRGNEFLEHDISALLEMLATVDIAVIGPGLDRSPATQLCIHQLIESTPCPLVLDASALQPWTLDAVQKKSVILTPHLGELERMRVEPENIGETAKKYGIIIHLKGRIDRIALPDGTIREIAGGNAGLTVGGTGDTLAGVIAGLRSQGVSAADACATASTVIKRSADILQRDYGYAYGTRRLIEMIPKVLHALPQ